ncbi:hypothetical protein K402DRAFT_57907 [Aulographum hederae CBS 113979]|uniref:Zygote-specific protein n=1 Tax=Aulographum hederae CBS 113979 TaxID=1176131 RepID=A0A6G1H2S7_9PEZI|nr:hypothetical protein K402DRAFT_57907 [Aulographum hederae CBS 113979]
MRPRAILIASLLLAAATSVSAGPASYGICQAGCASVVMACYAAAGANWGAVLAFGAPSAVATCNAAFGPCQSACHVVACIPFL